MAKTRAQGSARKNERFSTVPPTRVPRSVFDRSYTHKTTLDSGLLYPVYADELLPGDTITWRPAFFARLATPLKPFMDGLHLDWQVFAVPIRLVHDNFVKMMGERLNPDDHIDYQVPQMQAPPSIGHPPGTLADYLGIPVGVADLRHSAYWHRAYNLIWNEWYRDENLQDQVVVDTDDADSDVADYQLLRRGKRKDYFTGALPFAQKGDDVLLSLGTSAPVDITASGTWLFQGQSSNETMRIVPNAGGANQVNADFQSTAGSGPWMTANEGTQYLAGLSATADLANALGPNVNALRLAIAQQQFLERDARGGTRYREVTLAHFGVVTDDIRLYRPQLLSTGSMAIGPMPVPNTTGPSGGANQGDLAAYAMGTQVGRGFNYSATEHCLLLGMVSVRADLTYQQGLNRMFSRKTRLDFYWPDFAHLGEQAVLSKEIYADGTGDEALGTGDFSVWGYQPRYEEYRHRTSQITGQFRSTHPTPLDVWHLGLDFDTTRPSLDDTFIQENPPVSRIVAVPSEPEFLLDCFFKITHARPMPKFGTPGLTRF